MRETTFQMRHKKLQKFTGNLQEINKTTTFKFPQSEDVSNNRTPTNIKGTLPPRLLDYLGSYRNLLLDYLGSYRNL